MAAQRGAHVVFCDRPEREAEGDRVMSAARGAGAVGRVAFLAADVSREEDVDRLFDVALEQLSGCHVLINNVENTAVHAEKSLVETPLADWNEVLAANLRQPFWLSRRAVEEFLASGEGGRIVHIASAVANGPTAGASYAASQTALHAFIRSVAKEYGRRGIACNGVVIWGYPEGEMTGAVNPLGQRALDPQPAHRLLSQPELVFSQVERSAAEATLFLASNEASFVNGEVLHVTGDAQNSLNPNP
jgi:3-oxoacyl-[acyl-carrier protein] reductase